MTAKPKRLSITFLENDPIWQVLDKLSKANYDLFSHADLMRQAIKDKFDTLISKTDLTLEDIERIGWANISTQELVDRYPPYRKQYQELDDLEMCTEEENDKILKELGLYVQA